MKIINNNRFKGIDTVEVKDNQAVYDKAKEVLVTVIENLDFINFRKGFSFSKSVDSIEYSLENMLTDEQITDLSNYMFAAPFVVKVDDVEYCVIVDKIKNEAFTVKFIFKVFK